MFDQPEFEALLRTNLKRHPHADASRRRRGHRHRRRRATDRVRVTLRRPHRRPRARRRGRLRAGLRRRQQLMRAGSAPRCRISGSSNAGSSSTSPPTADLDQWEGVHQVCDPDRAATYMRIGETRYRWEFRLLPGETADDYATLDGARPAASRRGSRTCRGRRARAGPRHRVHVPGADSPTAGGAATSSCSATPPTSPRRSSGRAWAPGCAMR